MISLSSQLIALRRLNRVDQDLRVLDKRLNTGVRIADTRDSTSALSASRASSFRSASFSTVQNSLDLGIATVSTASTAVTSASGFLGNIRDLLEAAKDGNADLASIQAQLTDQRMRLRSTVSGAAFKNVNLLASSTSASGYLGAPKDATGAAYSIDVDRNRTRLLDTLGTTGILQKTFDLSSAGPDGPSAAPSTLGLSGAAVRTDGNAASTPTADGLSGTASSVAGLAANPPATGGLSGTASAVDGAAGVIPARTGLHGVATSVVTGAVATSATAAKAIIGTFNPSSSGIKSGDTVQLAMTVNGIYNVATVYMRTVENAATLKMELQRAVDGAYGAGVLVADVSADNKISLQTGRTTGSGASVNVSSVTVVDGNDVTTSTLALWTDANYVTTRATIDGESRIRDSLNSFDLNGIDRTDRLEMKIDGILTNNATGSVTIRVKLTNVTDLASLAAAIDDEIRLNHSSYYSYFGAAHDGTNILVYHKHANAQGIRVSQINALNGNGTIAGNLGLATGSANGTAAVAETPASFISGTAFSEAITLGTGAKLNFNFSVNGSATAVEINKATVETALANRTGYTAGTGTMDDVGELALVTQQALRNAGIANVDITVSGARLKFTKTGTPANGDTLDISAVNTTTSRATAATLTTGSEFVGSRTIAENASLDFTLTVDGAATNVSITKADVDQALNGRGGYISGSGTITSATELALAARAAMTRQGLSNVTVAASGSRLVFTKTPAGAGTLAISNVDGKSTATNAVATAGSTFTSAITVAEGAAIEFDVALDNGAVSTVRIGKSTVETALAGVAGRTAGTGTIANAAEFALVAQQALSEASVTGITVGTSGGALTFTRTAAGAGSVALSNVRGMAGGATVAALTTGSDFAGPVTIDPGASIGFDLAVDNGAAQRVTIQNSTVETALAGVAGRTAGTGMIANVSEFALVVQRALAEANVGGMNVAVESNRITLSKTSTGAGQIAIANVTSTAGSVLVPSATTIDSINVNSTGFAGLSASQRRALLDDYVGNIDLMARRVGQAASYLSFVGRQMDIQSRHTGKLQGIEASRVGGLVNANLDAEGARRAALEARLALVRKSIEIVNQSRRNVLDIF